MPFLPLKTISNPNFNCDRDKNMYFADIALIVRPKCLENMKMAPPQKWMGGKLHQWDQKMDVT